MPKGVYARIRGVNVHPRDPVKRFWKYVQKGPDCWTWLGFVGPEGYARFHRGGSRAGYWLAHRYSWELHNGEIPARSARERLMVCHHCDNRRCVRPDHLFLGNVKDNADDAGRKGRLAVGVRAGNAVLDDARVREIRLRYSTGASMYSIARVIGCSQQAVMRVVKGIGWRHVS